MQQLLVVASLAHGTHGDGLYRIVGPLARQPLPDEGVHHPLGEDDAARTVDVFQHHLREDRQVLQYTAETREHVVEEHGGIGQDDALGSRMGDVALVPQGHILIERKHVAAHHACTPRNVFAAYRIALVRHGTRPLLALAERLLHFVHLRALQVPHFESHLFERCGDHGERCHIVGVPVALNHLRGDIGALDAQFLAHVVLYERRYVGEIADRSAQLAHLDVAGGRTETLQIPHHLLVPQHPFESETGDVGMNTVRTPDAGRIPETERLPAQHLDEILYVFQQYLVGLFDKITVGGIHHIGTRQSVMHPFALLAEGFADGTRKGHDIMVGLLLDLLDPIDAEGGLLPQFGNILFGDDTEFAPRLGSKDLHLQVCLEFPLFCPNGPHGRPAVSLYHIRIGFAKEQRYKIHRHYSTYRPIISTFPRSRHRTPRSGTPFAVFTPIVGLPFSRRRTQRLATARPARQRPIRHPPPRRSHLHRQPIRQQLFSLTGNLLQPPEARPQKPPPPSLPSPTATPHPTTTVLPGHQPLANP